MTARNGKPYLLTDPSDVDHPWLAYVRFTVNVTVGRKATGVSTETFIGTIGITPAGRIVYPQAMLAEPADALVLAEALTMAAEYAREHCTDVEQKD